VKAVFFIHDLLPLDHPEFFPARWQASFRQIVAAVMTRATGLLVASEILRARVEVELARFGRKDVAIHVAPLPPAAVFLSKPTIDEQLRSVPYFVVCGTIEPRKNHLLLLNLWRRFAEENERRPALVLIGHRGWENDHVTALLDRCPPLRERVLEAAGVSDAVQHWLLSNACAAFYPSFAEGYGLPVVEALSLGLPTVTSNIPVLREISQGRALFCDPLNAQEWREAASLLGARSAPSWQIAAQLANRFQPPTWSAYFSSLINFLESL
jgi:glycosyltransferase involved in cell wall biosynthesis